MDWEVARDLGIDTILKEIGIEHLPLPRNRYEAEGRIRFFEDLENPGIEDVILKFIESMESCFRKLKFSREIDGKWLKMGWYLEAILEYTQSVSETLKRISKLKITSSPMIELYEKLQSTAENLRFYETMNKALSIDERLSGITFDLFIRENRVEIRRVDTAEDLAREVEELIDLAVPFEIEEPTLRVDSLLGMSWIENEIMEGVSRIFPDVFEDLENLYNEFLDIIDTDIVELSRILKIFLKYHSLMKNLERTGLKFSPPRFDDYIEIEGAFDLSIAWKSSKIPWKSDIRLDKSVILFILGHSGSGKTTLLKSLGQIFLLSRMGFPVPAERAIVPFVDRVLTHFPSREKAEDMKSAFEKDLIRLKNILDSATDKSVIFLDEPLSSTSTSGAVRIGRELIEMFKQKNTTVFWVTLFRDLATNGEHDTLIVDKPSNASSVLHELELELNNLKRRLKDELADSEKL